MRNWSLHIERLIGFIERLEPRLFEKVAGELSRDCGNDLLNVKLEVAYDRLGHDVHCVCRAKCLSEETVIRTINMWNGSAEYWVPQWSPWVSCRINPMELGSGQFAALKLTDSKWNAQDTGMECVCAVEGIVETDGQYKAFLFEHNYTYAGTDRP